MPEGHEIQFANFVCKFGSELNLLDLFEEVLYPCFMTDARRRYGRTRYILHETRLLNLAESANPVLAVAGRLIKDTTLRREQILTEESVLMHDEQSMQSSPSALFCLVLNDHKLLYVHETPYAPTLGNFEATVGYHAKIHHRAFIDRLHDAHRQRRLVDPQLLKMTKKALLERYPSPRIHVVPMATRASLAEFVGRYSLLKVVRASLVAVNDELDLNSLFRQARLAKQDIGAKTTTLEHRAPHGLGLEKEKAIQQLESAAAHGHAEIKLDGKDEHGGRLVGNNDEFKVKIPVEEISRDPSEAAQEMYSLYTNLLEDGTLTFPNSENDADTRREIERLSRTLLS